MSACAPSPMPAARASEVLELFAAGDGPADICSAQGRALLRSAVRAYSTEMRRSGVSWPALPGQSEALRAVDASVLIAVAAGFVQASDIRNPSRRFIGAFPLAERPEIALMQSAGRAACDEVRALQRAAARFVLERQVYHVAAAQGLNPERVEARLARAEAALRFSAAALEARLRRAELG